MRKKPPAPRRTHIKEAHTCLQEALLLAGRKAAAEGASRDQTQGHAAVAKALGVSTSLLYKWREPETQGSGHPNPLERTARLIEATGDPRIMDWLAQRAGGHFTPVESEAEAAELHKAANALVREFGLLIAGVVDAIRDERVTPEETQLLRAHWDGLRKRAESFVRTCEKGGYAKDS